GQGSLGADDHAQRFFQGLCDDRLAGGLSLCAKGDLRGGAQDPPVCHALCTGDGQIGALEALRSAEDEKTSMVNEYRLRRNMFVAGLNQIGLSCHVPEGAFYAFPSV